MTRIQVFIILLCFIFNFKLSANTSCPVGNSIIEDSTVRVLVLTHKTNNKQKVFAVGTSIKYWRKKPNFAFKGIIEGFSAGAIIIDGRHIPLNQISKIKRLKSDRETTSKVLLAIMSLGVLISGVMSILARGYDSDWPSILGWTAGLALLFTLITLVINLPKKLETKYEANIIEVSVNQYSSIQTN